MSINLNLTVSKLLSKEYKLSNYIKNDRPYFVMTVELTDQDGNKFHHNVHFEERVGGYNKELMNSFDNILRDIIEENIIGKKKVIIENVNPYNFTCSISKRSWIQPNNNTKVKVVGLYNTQEISIAA